MQPNREKTLFLLVGGVLLFVYGMLDILSSGRNQLGQLYYYVMLVSAFVAFITPKGGVYLLVLYSAYLDFCKRLLPLVGSTSGLDVFWAMGIAPAAMAGAFAGCLLPVVGMASQQVTKSQRLLFAGVLVLMSMLTAQILVSAVGVSNVLQDVANKVSYMGLVALIPMHFRASAELRRLLQFTLIVYIPVAMYFFYQYANGLAWWERAYLDQGFSIEVRQDRMRIFRYFSTMNNAQSLSALMSLLIVVAMCAPWSARRWAITSYFNGRALLVSLLFGIVCVLTYSRSGWLVGLGALFASICFRSAKLTAVFYGTVISLVITLFMSAGWLLHNQVLESVDRSVAYASKSIGFTQATRVITFQARLEGMRRLVENGNNWKPFGLIGKRVEADEFSKLQGIYYSHDAISNFIIRYGYILAALSFIVAAVLIKRLHSAYFRLENEEDKKIVLLGMAGAFGILLSGLASQSVTKMFPVNMYLYLFMGMALAPLLNRQNVPTEILDIAEEEEDEKGEVRLSVAARRSELILER